MNFVECIILLIKYTFNEITTQMFERKHLEKSHFSYLINYNYKDLSKYILTSNNDDPKRAVKLYINFMEKHLKSDQTKLLQDHHDIKNLTDKQWLDLVDKNILIFLSLPDRLKTLDLCKKAALNLKGIVLKYIPEKFRTKEICTAAVTTFGIALKWCPLNLITVDICERAVKNDGRAYHYVPKKFREYDVNYLTVNNNGLMIKEFKNPFRFEILAAVRNNGLAIKHLDLKVIDEEIILEAVKQNIDAIEHVPQEFLTEELYLKLVNLTPHILWYIPKENQSKDICLKAVNKDGLALLHVLDLDLFESLIPQAIASNGMIYDFLSYIYKTKDNKILYNNAPKNNPFISDLMKDIFAKNLLETGVTISQNKIIHPIDFMKVFSKLSIKNADPEDIIKYILHHHEGPHDNDEAIINKLFREDAIKDFHWETENYDFYIDDTISNDISMLTSALEVLYSETENNINEDVCKTALTISGYAIFYINPDIITEEMYDLALSHCPLAIYCVPEEYLSYNKCLQLAEQDGRTLYKMPEEYIDLTMIRKAIESSDSVPRLDPSYSEFLTREDYITVIRKYGAFVNFVPQDLLDEEMCLEAIGNTPLAITTIPTKFLTEAFLKKAISVDPHCLYFVPFQLQTLELCELAFSLLPLSVAHIKNLNTFNIIGKKYFEEILDKPPGHNDF